MSITSDSNSNPTVSTESFLPITGIKILYPITSSGQVVEQTLNNLRGYRDSQPVRIGNGAAGQVQLDVYGEL